MHKSTLSGKIKDESAFNLHKMPEIYTPLYKHNQLIIGSHPHIAIVSGWFPAKTLAERLVKEEYAVIGQLYSASRGIDFFLRNLLANPQITKVVLLQATKEDFNSGSIQALFDFFLKGYTSVDNKIKINSTIDAEISQDLKDELFYLRERVAVELFFSVFKCIESVRKMKALSTPVNYEPRFIKLPGTKVDTTIPSEIIGQRVVGETITECWIKLLHEIRLHGNIKKHGYDGLWQELIDLIVVVKDEPNDFFIPDYLPVDRQFIESYLPQMCYDAPYVEGVKYSYGQRIRSYFEVDQLKQIINKLNREPDAASAVINLWDIKDHDRGGSPCLNHLWFRIVENKLILSALFRSNDMFSAWVSNAMGLRHLQKIVVEELKALSNNAGLEAGELITISQSAHIYDDCWDTVDTLLLNRIELITKNRFDDPTGNFIIESAFKNTIVVTQIKNLKPIRVYESTQPKIIIQDILTNNSSIQPKHAAYLGYELNEIYRCLKTGEIYVQG